MLKQSYGKIKIKKGSILYHTSDNKFTKKMDKPFLFLTFHPSEWDILNKYVTFIKLKKDMSLLFMIEGFKNARIYSSLNTFTKHPNLNLAKKYDNNLICYTKELIKENFDGWFSSIENKVSVEVGLINDNNNYEVLKTEKLERNWINSSCLTGKIVYKNWGVKYPICTIEQPVKLKINLRYKNMIEEYKKYEKKSKYLLETIFQIILENAQIYYHKKNVKEIIWNCD